TCALTISGRAAVGEPVGEEAVGQVVQGAGAPVDGEPSVGQVDVVECEGADLAVAGGVHCGQCDVEARLGRGRGGDRLVDVLGFQGLEDPVLDRKSTRLNSSHVKIS